MRAASLTLCLGARKLDVFSAYLHNNGDRVAILREGFLSRFLGRWFRSLMVVAVLGLLAPGCLADGNNPITLETSETIFAVLTAMNTCGYNVNLNASDAQRLNIRAEVERNLKGSEEAQATMNTMCEWYLAHRGKDPAHDLSQYISLALYLRRLRRSGRCWSGSTTKPSCTRFGSGTGRTMPR